MTWAPAPPSPSADPSAASSTSPLRGEVTLGVLAANGGGMVEAGVLADLGRAALGGLVTLGAVNEHLGVGLHLAGGPRFALSGRARLDLQLDLGLIRFGDDGEGSGFTVTERSGSEEVRPSVGARLGLTMTRATSGWFVSVGAGIRHVPRSTVQYTVTECPFLGPCRTTPATATYGGTLAGAYLTVGRPHPRR